MLVEHRGKRPTVDPSAYVAPTAVVCGDVTIGTESRVLFGAVIVAEGGRVMIGRQCIIRENAVIRSTDHDDVRMGDHVLVGPRSYLMGCEVGDEVFLATGATVFNGARLGRRAEVRINGVVHVRTVLPEDGLVPIGWIAVGDPAQIWPPHEHDRIWAVQEPLEFTRTVYGVDRAPTGQSAMPEITRHLAELLSAHRDDRIL